MALTIAVCVRSKRPNPMGKMEEVIETKQIPIATLKKKLGPNYQAFMDGTPFKVGNYVMEVC